MFLQLIDVLIGLTVVYIVFSTVASSAAELVEAWLQRRGRLLQRGIAEILRAAQRQPPDHARLASLVAALYNSPQIGSLFGGQVQADLSAADGLKVSGGRLPSYIAPERFAAAVQWLARHAQDDGHRLACTELLSAAASVASDTAAGTTASTTASTAQQLAAYFSASTERISGWYRRHVQTLLFALGCALALGFNLDSIAMFRTLSQDARLRAQIVEGVLEERSHLYQAPQACEAGSQGADPLACEQALKLELSARLAQAAELGLPIGWQAGWPDPWGERLAWLLQKLAGCLITALAICLGAPFWYDMLNQLTRLRSSVKPAEPTAKQRTGGDAGST